MSKYPTEQDLQKIHEVDGRVDISLKERVSKMLTHLKSIWHYPDYFVDNGKDGFELHTGGWSGNESIISELEETSFWIMFWQRTERGGHYYFDYQMIKMDEKKEQFQGGEG